MSNDRTTALNRLPVMIHRPGLYLMRNGSHVEIDTVNLYDKPDRLEVTIFEAQGKRIGKSKARGIWHVSGRFYAVEESDQDIVAKVRDTSSEYKRQGGCYCPVCGCGTIGGGEVVIHQGAASQESFCTACDATWTDNYSLSGYSKLEQP